MFIYIQSGHRTRYTPVTATTGSPMIGAHAKSVAWWETESTEAPVMDIHRRKRKRREQRAIAAEIAAMVAEDDIDDDPASIDDDPRWWAFQPVWEPFAPDDNPIDLPSIDDDYEPIDDDHLEPFAAEDALDFIAGIAGMTASPEIGWGMTIIDTTNH